MSRALMTLLGTLLLALLISCSPPALPPIPPSATGDTGDLTGFGLSLPEGMSIARFTPDGLGGKARFMAFSPDGILFLTRSSSTTRWGGRDGGRVLALPDTDGDGVADEVREVLTLTDLPHGIAFYDGYLYVAEETRVSRYPYLGSGVVDADAGEVVVPDLPAGGHVSRTVVFSPTGKMYVSVGSSCNLCEERDPRVAAVLEFDPDGSNGRVFVNGTRNAVGMVFSPEGKLWATENSRDNLGDDLPPDEINILRVGRHYGWPYCYSDKVIDPWKGDESLCPETEPSSYDIQAHSAPLGLRFVEGPMFSDWEGDLVVAYHGSWNRREPTGYKVVRLDVEDGEVVAEEDIVTGWLGRDGSYTGRPVDVILGPDGSLYISDDYASLVYRMVRN